MTEEMITYLKGMTEQHAKTAFANAKQEAGQTGEWYRRTEAFNAYQAAIDMMRVLPQIGHRLSVENLQFMYYENKVNREDS